MNQNQQYNTQSNYPAAIEAERPEGHYTSRTRQLADEMERIVHRFDRVLHNVRGVPPPAPAEINSTSGLVRQMCLGDHLGRQESMMKSIDVMLNEMEGLL